MLGEHDDLLALVPRFGCDPLEQNYNFAEICHRSRKRWDMRVPGEAVSALTSTAVQASLPVILGLDRLPLHPDEGRLPLARRLPAGKPRTLMTGAIVSQPGARAQRFHTDADGGHLAARAAHTAAHPRGLRHRRDHRGGIAFRCVMAATTRLPGETFP